MKDNVLRYSDLIKCELDLIKHLKFKPNKAPELKSKKQNYMYKLNSLLNDFNSFSDEEKNFNSSLIHELGHLYFGLKTNKFYFVSISLRGKIRIFFNSIKNHQIFNILYMDNDTYSNIIDGHIGSKVELFPNQCKKRNCKKCVDRKSYIAFALGSKIAKPLKRNGQFSSDHCIYLKLITIYNIKHLFKKFVSDNQDRIEGFNLNKLASNKEAERKDSLEKTKRKDDNKSNKKIVGY